MKNVRRTLLSLCCCWVVKDTILSHFFTMGGNLIGSKYCTTECEKTQKCPMGSICQFSIRKSLKYQVSNLRQLGKRQNCYFCALHSLTAVIFNQIWTYNKSRTLKLEIYMIKRISYCEPLQETSPRTNH